MRTTASGRAPVFELACNRLMIRADSEAQFLAGFEEHFWALMHSEYPRVTLDLSRSEGVADDAFRMIALIMFEVSNKGKQITIRIPEVLERFFRHANLYRVATIEVVHLLGKDESKGPEAEAAFGSPARGAAASNIGTAPGGGRATIPAPGLGAPREPAHTPGAGTAPRGTGSTSGASTAETRRGAGRLIDRRTGQVLEVAKNPTHIGRVPGNDILIAMPLVSKRHARIIQRTPGEYYVEDLGSSNGTYVNGERVSEPRRLLDGARVQIAITSQYPNGAKEYTFRQEP